MLKRLLCVLIFPPFLWAGLIGQIAPLHAGIVLSKPDYSPQAGAVIEEASRLLEENQPNAALERLETLGEKKDLLAPPVLLGELLLERGQIAQARKVLEDYSVGSGPCFDVFFAFGRMALLEQRWFDAFVHGQLASNQAMPERWTPEFQAKMKLEAQLLIMLACEGRGNWGQVVQVLTEIDLSATNDARVHELAGKSAFHANRVGDAMKHFQRVKTLRDDAADPKRIVARLYSSVGRDSQAQRAFQAAIDDAETARQPAKADEIRLELVQWLTERSLLSDARETLAKVNDPERVESQFATALLARLDGNYAAAAAILQRLHQESPDAFAIANHLAQTLTQLGDEDSRLAAMELASTTAEQHANSADAFATLGWTQLLNGQVEAAELSLARATSGGVISRDTAFFLSQLNLQKGNETEAERFADAARAGQGLFFFANWK